jgi:NAD(P)-dependent dehydrogenase (short-subunit alcohol dehydrogenase family)
MSVDYSGLKGKVIVITGASDGIGAALAKLAGSHGARVVLAARRESALQDVAAASGRETLVVAMDVTRREDHARLLASAIDRFGHVDVWVNNAGRGITKPVLALTDADVDEIMLINVKSVIYAMQEAVPHFQARGAGHVINISSMLGRIPLATFRSIYCASKHALNALTACLRQDLRTSYPNIHVSTVSPGIVATSFGTNAIGGGPDSRTLPGAQPVEEVADVIARTILSPAADVYTREGMRQMAARYYGADDMAVVEAELTLRPAPPAR